MKPVTKFVEVNVPTPIPNSLIHHPCSPVGVGNTVPSLAKGYTANTVCIGKYKEVVDGIGLYNESQKEAANVPRK